MVRFSIKNLISAPERSISEIIVAKKFQPVILVALVLIFASIFVSSYRIAYVEDDNSIFSLTRKSDFEDYYLASQTISRGGDPYKIENIKSIKKQFEWKDVADPMKIRDFLKSVRGVGTYLYPPFTAFLLLPLSGFSYSAATLIFQTLSILAFLMFLLVIYYFTDRNNLLHHFFLPMLVTSLMMYTFLNGNFLHGNILTFLLLLTAGGIYLSFRDEKFLNLAGGFLIGLAVIIKITPIFFGLVLFGKKRFTAIFGMGLGAMAGLALPALYTGYEENLILLQNWYDLILGNYGKQGIVRAWANNQSFSAMIGKLFLPGSDSGQAAYGLPLFGEASKLSVEKSFFYASVARYANILFLASGISISFYRMIRNLKRENHFDLEAMRLLYFSTILSLLTSGVSWYHAFGALFFPVFLRLNRHYQGEKLLFGEKLGYYLISVFGFFHLFMSGFLKEVLALYSIFTLFCVGIAVYTAYLLVSEKNGI